MTFQASTNKEFSGGIATDKKLGLKHSAADIQSMDFRKSPSQISVLPTTRRADANIVKDLIQNEVMTNSGTIYSLGSDGYIYRVINGVYSVFGKVRNGKYGISYREDQNSIYITSDSTVSSITKTDGTPSLNVDFYNISQSTYNNSSVATFNVNTNQSGSTNTTVVGTSYIEGFNEQTRYFQTDIEPLNKIGVNVGNKGTGDWTLVLHDGLGTQLASVTITNTNLVTGKFNYFVFPSPIRVSVAPAAQTYHWHLTSTVADGTVYSSETHNLSTADMELWADRLIVTNNGMHPMQTFQQFETIGNGRYLSVWEPLGEPSPSNAEWQRHKLVFPPGYEVCGLTVFNEYLVIATEATTTGINTPQSGIIFYWDGLSDKYNYFTKIPEGSPQGIHEADNTIFYIANGTRYAISSVAAQPQKVRKMPNSESTYTISNTTNKVYPYTAAVRNGIQLFAWPSVTTNPAIKYGIYSFGRVDYSFPNAFGYSYSLSTGSKYYDGSNSLTIGMVKNFGDILHISWRDGSSYGVDVVDNTSKPAAFTYWESLIEDYGYINKDKTATAVTGTWLPLSNGVRVRLKVSIDRGAWQYSQYFSNTDTYLDGDGSAKFDVGEQDVGARFREVQYGIEVYCDDTVTEPPVITEVALIFDDNASEALQ